MKTASVSIMMLITGLIMAAMIPSTATAQCATGGNPSVPLSTPDGDFEAGDDGTVLHVPTRLIWQRCVLGQTWNGSSCEGTPELYNWTEALLVASGHIQDDQADWRVPNRNELGAIVEYRCELPAVNATVFPGTPGGGHWTSSPFAGGASESWIVDFDSGRIVPATTQTPLPVRLVRGGQFFAP